MNLGKTKESTDSPALNGKFKTRLAPEEVQQYSPTYQCLMGVIVSHFEILFKSL